MTQCQGYGSWGTFQYFTKLKAEKEFNSGCDLLADTTMHPVNNAVKRKGPCLVTKIRPTQRVIFSSFQHLLCVVFALTIYASVITHKHPLLYQPYNYFLDNQSCRQKKHRENMSTMLKMCVNQLKMCLYLSFNLVTWTPNFVST